MNHHSGPAQLVQAAAVARRHYLDRESKVEIAEALGISRFKVARLLDLAHEAGLVRIEIAPHGVLDVDLSAAVKDAFGLRHCAIVLADSLAETRRRLGRVAGDLLSELVGPDDVLGFPWARSIADLVAALDDLPPIPVVQLSGSLVLPGESSSPVDLVRQAAALAGGESHLYFAPMLLDDAASASVLRRQASVADALAQVHRVTIAVVGVGTWGPGTSTVHDVLTPAERAELAALGVVAEVAGVFCDEFGAIETPVDGRMITITAAQLRDIPEVIAVAAGEQKASGIRAAIGAGLVKSLVADTAVARALLAASGRSAAVGG